MAARSRESLERSGSSESQMTYTRFLEFFPDSDACVEYLKERFYPEGTECPRCHRASKFHKVSGRAAYSCQYCRHQVYPTAGTIFHKSTVSMQLWFWAIYLMSSTRCGISAKQLEREIGVSYKTAHRMFKQIRSLLQDGGEPLSGNVEMDESYLGGRTRGRTGRPGADSKKVPVFGMVERGGRVVAATVPNVKRATIMPQVHRHVLPESMIYTDEYPVYDRLSEVGYRHRRIYHAERVYVAGDVHTNTIEGFFGLVKNGIRGVYHSVSRCYLQSYLDEYAFRYNQRRSAQPMFWTILERVSKGRPAAA